MWKIKSIVDGIFDLLMWPFQSLHPLWSLLFLSLLTGIFILLVFRYTSDQKGIKKAKDKIKAHLLEIRIFKDSLRIQLSAQKRLFIYNVIYMKHAIIPLLFMIIPVVLLIVQMDAWYGHKPLTPGESTVLSVWVPDEGTRELPSNISLEASKGLTVETPLLRIPETRELSWRIRVNELGNQKVIVKTASHALHKDILVADGRLARISPLSINSSMWTSIVNPGVEHFPKNPFLNKIEVRYPSRSMEIFGWKIHWLILFFIFTTVIAFAFKNFFRVEI